ISENGLVDSAMSRNDLIYINQTWIEQDPAQIKNGIIKTIRSLVDAHKDLVNKVAGLVFTSQMQGILPVDKEGKPLHNIITWMDSRAAEITKQKIGKGFLKISGYPLKYLVPFLKITGGAPGFDGKNTLSKSLWIKKFLPKLYQDTYKFLDTKDYAVLCAANVFKTSEDMAYITWLMDTRNGKRSWSQKICDMMDLDIEKYPEIGLSTDVLGTITDDFAQLTGLNKDTKVINGSGDLLTSALGSGAIIDGQLHANIGTAGWVGAHFSKKKKDIAHYTGAIASAIPGKYLILSKQETLGGALEWFRHLFNENDFFKSLSLSPSPKFDITYKDLDDIAKQSPAGSKGLIFTPWLTGERSPINDFKIRSMFLNIDIHHNFNDIVRSIYEGVAYNLNWGLYYVEKLIKSVKKPYKNPKNNTNNDSIISDPRSIRIIGGGSKSDIWAQIFADVWNKNVIRMEHPQYASSIGAATIAFVGLGIFKEFNEIKKIIKVDKIFTPNQNNHKIYQNYYVHFINIYKYYKKWLPK
ncbi:MAG: xylulokinase, partial [Promethearchaeota archaeon]